MSEDFRCGELSFSEWDGLWKAELFEDDAHYKEYEKASTELHHHLIAKLNLQEDDPKVYPIANFWGDRTQDIAVEEAGFLDRKLIEACQEWLRLPNRTNWRCRIDTTCIPETTIIVYPDTVRISAEYEKDLDAGLTKLRPMLEEYIGQVLSTLPKDYDYSADLNKDVKLVKTCYLDGVKLTDALAAELGADGEIVTIFASRSKLPDNLEIEAGREFSLRLDYNTGDSIELQAEIECVTEEEDDKLVIRLITEKMYEDLDSD